MANELTLFLFGDQTFDLRPHVKSLFEKRRNPILNDFLDKTYDALRAEIHQLPSSISGGLPRFTCKDDFATWTGSGDGNQALAMAMASLYQLGLFISQADERCYYGNSDRNQALGICTGALAAAAVDSSRSLLGLIPNAVQAVLAAFRLGRRVTEVAARLALTSSVDNEGSWSILVAGAEASETVMRAVEQLTLPVATKPYISAYSANGVTVSGLPTSLRKLIDSESFEQLRAKTRSINAYAAYHAAHLYSQHDVEDVLGASVEHELYPRLRAAVEGILLHPIRWGDIIEDLRLSIARTTPKSFTIVPIASTADQFIYSALRQTCLRPLIAASDKPSFTIPEALDTNPDNPKLAIIGMSGRWPGAKDNDAFWNLLHQGLDVHKPVPPLHWDVKTHVDPTRTKKNSSATPFGCWLDDPAEFDARFFNISPREAPQLDPAQRLALMTAYEAIEQAGLVPNATSSTRSDRVGVFYGVTSNDWMETNSAQNIDTYFIPGGNRAFIPGRINYCFKFSGPSYAVDTACSSSLAGIHLACNSLWRRDVDTAIAGGTNVLTNPDFTAGLDRGHFLSHTGNCKTFDDTADGYCRGEGIGTIIIKRLDDALADKDPILGTILGAYTNHSAEAESITRPHSGAQRAIFSKILNQAAVDPYSVSYVEMHGTGTQAGDAGEMASVLDVFAPPAAHTKKARTVDEALYLGSAKANIGHGEAASGVSSLIKVLLMMQNNTIVPHCGIKTRINRNFPTDLKDRNVNIALKPITWHSSKPRRAFVNNFSAAGGNSALLIEDALLVQHPNSVDTDPRCTHVVAVSAKNGVSLQGNLRSMIAFLGQQPEVPISQLSYTTTARRMHHQHRVMLTGSTTAEIRHMALEALRAETGTTRPKNASKPIFTFTGQGAQYPGMGRELMQKLSLFRTELHQLDRIVQTLGFPTILQVIQSEETDVGNFDPVAVQLANTCMQLALCKLWASWGVAPAAVIGHSLGEYAALNIAGVLSDVDTLYLVGTRAALLQERCTRDSHSMLVVKGSVDEIAPVLKQARVSFEYACLNSRVETVLAGSNSEMEAAQSALDASNLRSTVLRVPYAFHSSQMEPILPDFIKMASAVTFSQSRIPIVCPLDGGVVPSGEGGGTGIGPEYLARHCRQPVNMQGALMAAYQTRIINDDSTLLEIGPHPAIVSMVRATLGPKILSLVSSQRGRSPWQVLASSLKDLYEKGTQLRWLEYHRDFPICHRVVSLPAYSWDLKEYWLQYVNDWSLRKGDPPLILNSDTPRPLKSTTIHRIVEEISVADKTTVVAEADIARADLSPLVQGHEVDGIPLCTPSVYADMALTLGNYLLGRYRPDQQKRLVDITEMIISKALIFRVEAVKQLLQAHAEADWSTGAIPIKFMSFDNEQKLQEHARCTILFKDGSLQQQLQSQAAKIKTRIRALQEGVVSGETARFNQPMVYRAIRPLARFHDDYRVIQEIYLNSKTLEASTNLGFHAINRNGDFNTHPAIIDALTQGCGFTMNCNDDSDLDVEVFMNHGWGSFQMFEPMDFEKMYTAYTRMQQAPDKLWHGDSIIFDGDRVVAHFGKIAIQGVPRRVLKVILSLESRSHNHKSQASKTLNESACFLQSPVTPPRNSQISRAIAIIAQHSGIAVKDLTDDSVFSDIGIDSLLGLIISAQFHEELGIDLDSNAFFYEYPRIGDLKAFLGGIDSSGEACPPQSDSSSQRSESSTDTSVSNDGKSYPAVKMCFEEAVRIISEESKIAPRNFSFDARFDDLGIDSLLSLVIVSRLRDELGLNIQHESFVSKFETVGDLRNFIYGEKPTAKALTEPTKISQVERKPKSSTDFWASDTAKIDLVTRKKAVDAYVERYTANFSPPVPSSIAPLPTVNEKVVLVTGATGSLGGHLVYYLAHLPNVKTVVCLNRDNRQEAYARQRKAMREKGIRFPESLDSKLVVLQGDTTKQNFSLLEQQYNELVGSVTHLIHNAWPMSAKRTLPGFESQFQIMQNLIRFACDVASGRPRQFKFSFQLVSSIGVVGHFGLAEASEKIMVPEDRVKIDSVLPNGYGEAKWCCERMLDETLHKHPDRFRTMIARLGQIAGSKTSGFWNPMEHFGFIIKSSQTLKALPDVSGMLYWTPVNDVATALIDLVLGEHDPYLIYHIDNPVGQPWHEMNKILANALDIRQLVPFGEWVEKVREAPYQNNPASNLLDFLDRNYLRMSCGGLVLDVTKSLLHSPSLSEVGPVSEEIVRRYIHVWKEIGFLK